MKKILTIGGATQDIFITYEDAETLHLHTKKERAHYLLLKEGSKAEVTALLYSSGGGANNTAFSFHKMGFSVTPFITVGDDAPGKFVLNKLQQAGIDTRLVRIVPGEQTGISFVIPSSSGDRAILAWRGVNSTLTTQEIPFDIFAAYDQLYVTSLSGASAQLLLPIAQKAHAIGKPIATNPGTSQLIAGAQILQQSLPYIDILILNSSEAKKLMLSLVQTSTALKTMLSRSTHASKDSTLPFLLAAPINIEDVWFSLAHFFETVLATGTRIVVVTNGAEGVYVATKQGIYFHPSLPAPVINTLGAGDAFGSSFVGSLLAGNSIETAIRHGIINSSSVIGYMDTKQGLLSLTDLATKEKTLNHNLLQKFNF